MGKDSDEGKHYAIIEIVDDRTELGLYGIN